MINKKIGGVLSTLLISTSAAMERIPDVTVMARHKTYPSVVPYFAQTITKEDIKRAGAIHPTDLLKNKAGVQTRDSTGNGASFEASLRGFGSNAAANTLIIVDGIKQNGYDLMPPSLSFLSGEDIERIEIIPGSLGTLLGEEATGGVIEITTKKPSKRSFNVRPYYGGPFGRHGLGLTYSDLLPYVGYRLGLNLDHSSGYRARNGRHQKSAQVSLFFPLKTQNLRFNYLGTDEKIELPGALTEAQVQMDRRQAQNLHDFSKTLSHHFRGFYQTPISEHVGFDLVVGARQSKMQGVLSDFPLNQARTLYFVEPKLIGNWLFPRGEIILTAGAQGENFDYSLEAFGTTKANQKTVSPYVRATLPVYPKLALIAGARLAGQSCHLRDSYSTQAICGVKPFAVREIGLEYSPGSHMQLYLRRDENFRLPKVDEQTWIPQGAKLLKPQRGVSYELGARFTEIGSLSFYHLALQNEIDFDPLAISQGGFPGANRNLEPTVRNGAMFEIHYPLFKHAELSTHYTWTQARFGGGRIKNKKVPFVAEHVGGLSLNYTITPPWNAQIDYLYTESRYAIGDYENMHPRMKGFGLVQATLGYFAHPWRVTLHTHNLTNVVYNELAVLREQASGQKERYFYPAAKRTFTLTVEYAAE